MSWEPEKMSEIILRFTVEVNQWAKAYLGSCKGVWPLLRTGQHMWPWKSSGKHKLLRSVSYTTVGEALTPFPHLSQGARPLLTGFMDLVGVARGLISYLGLGFNFLSSFAFSICLSALLSCVKTFSICQWRGNISFVPSFHLQPPPRVHYSTALWPKVSTNKAHLQQDISIVSNA